MSEFTQPQQPYTRPPMPPERPEPDFKVGGEGNPLHEGDQPNLVLNISLFVLESGGEISQNYKFSRYDADTTKAGMFSTELQSLLNKYFG